MTLKVALEQLGFGPCYHMVEVFKNPQASGWWVDAADGKPDWDKIFNGYNACVDWPAATFYAQLAQAYPDAKVILTEREPEAWFRSTQATIFPNATPPASDAPFDQMFRKVIAQLFDSRMRDHDHVIDVFKRHNEAVRRRSRPSVCSFTTWRRAGRRCAASSALACRARRCRRSTPPRISGEWCAVCQRTIG